MIEHLFNVSEISYNREPSRLLECGTLTIQSFLRSEDSTMDSQTVQSFGEEWAKFSCFSEDEITGIGQLYFDIVPGAWLNPGETVVLDAGCGSGRWSRYLADLVKHIEAVDPSKAVLSAAALNADKSNVRVVQASIGDLPYADETFDMVVCLGVLHHTPDPAASLKTLVKKLKQDGKAILYLYYDLENRGPLFKSLFALVNLLRRGVSSLSPSRKHMVCDLLAFGVYLPLVACARVLKAILPSSNAYRKLPLSFYVDKSIRVIRNDALDRFGTPLEQRFSKQEIEELMLEAGLVNIKFSDQEPYWHAVGARGNAD